MITTETIDLYAHFGIDRKDAAGGHLLCWIWHTSDQISPLWRRRPAVLIFPGGGYYKVSPREAEPVAMRFLNQGYAAFVLDYSIFPSIFPTALREAAMAMRYIRENADLLEVNTTMVSAIGFSAGGHLCGTLGTMYDYPEVSDIGSAQILRPDALGLCYPVAVSWGNTHEGSFQNLTRHDTALRSRLSLDRLVRPDMPPVFLWHTRPDETVPVRNSLILANSLDEAGVDFALHVYHRGTHGLGTADEQCFPVYAVPDKSIDIMEWPEKMFQFFRELGFTVVDGRDNL